MWGQRRILESVQRFANRSEGVEDSSQRKRRGWRRRRMRKWFTFVNVCTIGDRQRTREDGQDNESERDGD